MKKILSVLLAVTLLVTTGVQLAFASEQVSQGDIYIVSNFTDKNGNAVGSSFYAESCSVSGSGFNAKYVQRVFIDSNDSVCLQIRNGLDIDSQKEITGTVTVREKGTGGARFTAKIADLFVQPLNRGFLNEVTTGKFELPSDYNTCQMRFATPEGKSVGTLNAVFRDASYNTTAYLDIRVVEQPKMFIGHNSDDDISLMKKYDGANIRFLNWPTSPKFTTTGTLGIVMEKSEYLYQRDDDGKLLAVTGSYNSDRGTREFKTSTLGRYVISDTKLSGAGTASSVAPSSVTPPPTSSGKPAPSSTTPPPASSSKPAASSSKPAESSSSVAPSSSESSSQSESSSEIAPPPSSSKPAEPSSSPASKPAEPNQGGGFPVVPVIIGLMIVVIGVGAAVLIFGRRNNGKKFDSWDE